ncbi:MAG: aconitate hydratase AcnA [Desulfobacterium sp.]|nr:aconitate hydratase AcnA [Desulfobacterium sp.]
MTFPDCRQELKIGDNRYTMHDITMLEKKGIADIQRLPFSIRVLLENLLRHMDGTLVKEADVMAVANWGKGAPAMIPFHPARVLMQDFTGVPAVVDLAVMRDAVVAANGDPEAINPLVPVDLVIDHSVQVDIHGQTDAVTLNVEKEYQRNDERYKLLKWAQKSFDNFRVVPPGSGICHQVNLEHLADVVHVNTETGTAYPDTLVGTDSHTTMINGLGVLGWGVGGIEAEAVMLGQPYFMTLPEVVGVKLTGTLTPGVTATDLVLQVTQTLRAENVVEKFVEFTGPGMANLSLTDRATLANMAPEYGATMGFFPVDGKTIDYLKLTNRNKSAEIAEAFCRTSQLFATGEEDIDFTRMVEIDLATVVASIAGPLQPKDRISLSRVKESLARKTDAEPGKQPGAEALTDHSIVIAAITSCTNTSNPYVMLGAGLVAKRAVEKGLKIPSFVKTSLSPGSRVVVDYLDDAGLMPSFEALGFHVAGFGCMTCIGNSGPLAPEVEKAIQENDLNVASVLSGNRNFEARIHQSIRSNYLMSPMLVVVYALAGTLDIDLESEPLAHTPEGKPVFMADIWPDAKEIEALVANHVKEAFFENQYANVFSGDQLWQALSVEESKTFAWDPDSLYIRKPPFFDGFTRELPQLGDIADARTLLLLGHSVTTDHISPAGAIPETYPGGRYLIENGVKPEAFNSYGSRRGNHEVMMRGTFGNIRIRNRLVDDQGSFTLVFPEKERAYVYDAAMAYQDRRVPLVILGGREYGTGSSRDWAAKGTTLLGVKAVICESFERIHRSNLVGMGVLPLVLKQGSFESLGIDGSEQFEIRDLDKMTPKCALRVRAKREDGTDVEFEVISRLDTDVELGYYRNGGILQYVLRQIIAA